VAEAGNTPRCRNARDLTEVVATNHAGKKSVRLRSRLVVAFRHAHTPDDRAAMDGAHQREIGSQRDERGHEVDVMIKVE
jgi:hypothetical protein